MGVNRIYPFYRVKSTVRKFAERLKELREEKGLSQMRLAMATGLGKTAIGFWEKNQTDITSDNLIVLAEFFNVTVGYLLGTES